MDSAANIQILANAEYRRTALVWRVEGNACLGVLTGGRQRAQQNNVTPRA
jgi:hypothetical protein